MSAAYRSPGIDQSVLAPLVIWMSREVAVLDPLVSALTAAASSIPSSEQLMKVQRPGSRKYHSVPSFAKVLEKNHPGGGKVVRLCYIVPGEPLESGWQQWKWEMVIRQDLATAWEGRPDRIRLDLEVTRFRCTQKQISHSTPMALFRHMFVSGLCGMDSSTEIEGGQYEWSPDLWPLGREISSTPESSGPTCADGHGIFPGERFCRACGGESLSPLPPIPMEMTTTLPARASEPSPPRIQATPVVLPQLKSTFSKSNELAPEQHLFRSDELGSDVSRKCINGHIAIGKFSYCRDCGQPFK
jgi:hypothetical protein